MKRKIFLHIGFHKTATSSIQEGLYQNREKLIEMGYLYPIAGISPESTNKNHHMLGRQFDSRLPASARRSISDELAEEIQTSACNNVILSFEDFSILDRSDIELLHEYLDGLGEISVIAYVRSQTGYFFSTWTQITKSSKSVVDWDQYIKFKTRGESADFYKRLQPWSDIFGLDNIKIGVFEKSQIEPDIFVDFLAMCDVPNAASFEAPPVLNISPGIKTLEVVRYLTSILGVTTIPEKECISHAVADFVQQFGDQHGWDTQKANLITEEQHERIMNLFQESNRKLAREYLGREELFQDQFSGYERVKFSVEDLRASEVLQLMAFVIQQLADNPYRIPKARRWHERLQEYRKGAVPLSIHDDSWEDGEIFTELSVENERLRRQIQSIYQTRGWKLLNAFRSLRRWMIGR